MAVLRDAVERAAERLTHAAANTVADGRESASPWARWNLLRNPFGELSADERARLAIGDDAAWIDSLRDRRAAVQILGDSGAGKTSQLLALRRRLPHAAYVCLSICGRAPPLPATRPLLLDEAQWLGRWACRRVFRAGGPLVLGTHVDLRRPLERFGFRVTTIELLGPPDFERLRHIVRGRLEAARRAAGPLPHVDDSLLRRLIQECGPNIRRLEWKLYDLFQSAAARPTAGRPASPPPCDGGQLSLTRTPEAAG